MSDDAKGKGRHVAGKVREEAGKLLGDREMAKKGRLDQTEGVAEQDAARAEESLEDAHRRKSAARIAKEGSE
ncbi:MAG: CsbD family protein [Longimicrobiales bacterium]